MLKQLVAMTRTLGERERELVIIGEGNTSCRQSDDAFWVKASGQQMQTIDEAGFVATYFAPILDLLDNPPPTQSAMQEVIQAAKVDRSADARPSIEVSFHAMLLHECGVNVIAHTHPTAVNQILCSTRADQFANNRIFPDEVVLCAPQSLLIPYADPGLPLAIIMREGVRKYNEKHGEPPRVILLKNHGLITLGQTPQEALNITYMAVKAAQIFMGACTIGEPVFMLREEVVHIYHRPDEIYRQEKFS